MNFHSYAYARACAASLERQSWRPLASVVVDHDPDPSAQRDLAAAHPALHWLSRPNRGFAAGANAVLSWVARRCSEASYVLLLNPDVVLGSGYAQTLIEHMAPESDVALASGKLLRPDGATLDSAGFRLTRHRRPRERGAEQPDRRQYDRCERVFAVTGAAMMLRRAALPALEVGGEVFDEDFFAYYEDTDLAWRADLLGWKTLYVPGATATHSRRWRRETRYRIEPDVRRHSFKNHYLQMVKNERAGSFLRDLPIIAGWEVVRLGFGLLRDPPLLRGYLDALRLLPRARAKRRIIHERAASLRRAPSA